MANSKPNAAAAVLAGSIQVAPLDPAEIMERLHVPAIRETFDGGRPPLNLDAAVIRYRVLANDRIVVVPELGRACWTRHRRR